MSRLRWLSIVAALAPALFVVPHALAQPASDGRSALTLGHEAIGLYNKGSWAEARAKFEEAERLTHSPVFVLYLARCARNAGDLAVAREAYRRLVKEVVPKDAPAPWAAAVESGKQELPELERRIAETSAAPTASAPSPSGTASTAPAGAPAGTAAPSSSAAPGSTGNVSSGPDRGGLAGPQRGSIAPGALALGLGAVGVGVGVGLFAHASSIAAGVNERCGGRATCPEELANKNTAVNFADGATGAFIVGAAALAAGVVLVIVRPGGKPATPAVAVQPGFASIRVSGAF